MWTSVLRTHRGDEATYEHGVVLVGAGLVRWQNRPDTVWRKPLDAEGDSDAAQAITLRPSDHGLSDKFLEHLIALLRPTRADQLL